MTSTDRWGVLSVANVILYIIMKWIMFELLIIITKYRRISLWERVIKYYEKVRD
jgi:hypothetical protein